MPAEVKEWINVHRSVSVCYSWHLFPTSFHPAVVWLCAHQDFALFVHQAGRVQVDHAACAKACPLGENQLPSSYDLLQVSQTRKMAFVGVYTYILGAVTHIDLMDYSCTSEHL